MTSRATIGSIVSKSKTQGSIVNQNPITNQEFVLEDYCFRKRLLAGTSSHASEKKDTFSLNFELAGMNASIKTEEVNFYSSEL